MSDQDLELIEALRKAYLMGWNGCLKGYPPEPDEELLNGLYNEYKRGYRAAKAYKNHVDK